MGIFYASHMITSQDKPYPVTCKENARGAWQLPPGGESMIKGAGKYLSIYDRVAGLHVSEVSKKLRKETKLSASTMHL